MPARSKPLASAACFLAFAFSLTHATATEPAPEASPPRPPPAPFRRLWSVRGVMDTPSAHTRTPVRAGTLLAWAYDSPSALVALDVRTGRERWRMPMPAEGQPEIALAGDLALVRRSIGVTAVDLGSGQQRWTRRLCRFMTDLQTVAELRVGVATCQVPEPPGERKWHPRMIMAVGVDLATGRELWRRETDAAAQAIVTAAGAVYLEVANTPYPNQMKQKGATVFVLDPRTGGVRRSFPLAHAPGHIQLFPGDPTRALFIGGDISAVSLTDGRVAWRQPAPIPLDWGALPFPRPELRDGRLVVAYETRIRELDLGSGAEIAGWEIPWAVATGHAIRQMVRPAPGGGALLIKDAWNQPAVAFRFGKPGAAPRVAPLEVSYESVLAVEEGVIVVRDHDGAAGFVASPD